MPADLDRDGRSELAVFRPSEGYWYIRYSPSGGGISEDILQWGVRETSHSSPTSTATDERPDGLFDPQPGTCLSLLVDAVHWRCRFPMGRAWRRATFLDFDGDGKTELTVYRPSTGSGSSGSSYGYGVLNIFNWGRQRRTAAPAMRRRCREHLFWSRVSSTSR